MNRINVSIFFLSILVISIPSTDAWGAKTQNNSGLNSLLSKEKSELDQLKARIRKQDKSLSAVGARETNLLRTMRRLDDQIKLKEREMKIYQWNIKINKNKVESLTQNIGKIEGQLDLQKVTLSNRFRNIYKEGSMFPIKLFFSADNFNDLLRRFKYIEILAAYDSTLFHKYKSRFKALEEEGAALLKARAILVRLEEDALGKKIEIKAQKAGKSAFLKKVKQEKRYKENIRKDLLNSSSSLNQLIARLEDKIIHGEGLDITDKKGRLDWPLKGKILNRFGKKMDKQYATYIVYNGINIKVLKGTPVRAVFAGKVLYKGSLEGYGNLVIVGHSKEYHSLYGHLDEILIDVGKTIRTGQIIGRSGDTGSLVGETLYFELRHKGKPINPMGWIHKKG